MRRRFLRVFVETPFMTGTILRANQGMGAASPFGHVMQVEAVVIDDPV